MSGIAKRTAVAEALVRDMIAHGPIPFAEFMRRALYGEGGYYVTDEPRIGRHGDFVTGSRSPLFAAATARLLAALDGQLGLPARMLEVGYGDGRHLEQLAARGRPGLLGHDRVRRPLPEEVTQVDRVEPQSVRGLVFSYELFDALPVHRLIARGGGWNELCVDVDVDAPDARPFSWIERPISDPGLATLVEGVEPVEGQVVDVAPAWADLYRRLAEALSGGLLVTCDYGYLRPQLLDARIRMHGTLACYRRHTVHRDPFVDVGRQDLTAHVDFTALIDAGEDAGLKTLGLLRLAEWLTALGIFEDLQDADRETAAEAQRLLAPAGMGSEIKVLVQVRGGVDAEDLGLDVDRSS